MEENQQDATTLVSIATRRQLVEDVVESGAQMAQAHLQLPHLPHQALLRQRQALLLELSTAPPLGT